MVLEDVATQYDSLQWRLSGMNTLLLQLPGLRSTAIQNQHCYDSDTARPCWIVKLACLQMLTAWSTLYTINVDVQAEGWF